VFAREIFLFVHVRIKIGGQVRNKTNKKPKEKATQKAEG